MFGLQRLLSSIYIAQQGLQCIRSKSCVMTPQTRNACHACRLQKCFAMGMKVSYLQGSRQKNGDKRLPEISPKNSPSPPFVLINQALSKLTNRYVSLGSLQIHKRWNEGATPIDVINYFVEVERICDEVYDEHTVGMSFDQFRELCTVDLSPEIAVANPGQIAPRIDMDWSLSHQFTDDYLKAIWCRQAVYFFDYASFLPDLELLDPAERTRLILSNSTRIMWLTIAFKTMKLCENNESLVLGLGQYYPLDDRADSDKSIFNEIARILYREAVIPMREMHLSSAEFAVAKAIYCFSSVSNLNDRSLQIIMRLRDKYTNVLNEYLLNDALCNYVDAIERITRIHGLLQVIEVTSNRFDKRMANIAITNKCQMRGKLTYDVHVRSA
ncbi:Nuclear hormone receptor family member nhr-34 [Aphelenchoides besseyi]|nr:Nuclear hormone receptor family member nhr-34 [Aphelenchoides besseyi]